MNALHLFFVVSTLAWAPQELPPRLRNALHAPPAKTSQIEWSVSWVGGYNDGLVERYVTRTAGETLWESNLGDENGFHEAKFRQASPETPDNGARSSKPPFWVPEERAWEYAVPKEENAGTSNFLVREGDVWQLVRAERPISGFVAPVKEAGSWFTWRPVEMSSVGLAPCFPSSAGDGLFRLPRHYSEGFESATFHEWSEDGLPTVSAEYTTDAGRIRLAWSFDDKRGGQPVRAALYTEGEPTWSSETDMEEVAGRWLPKTVRFYEGYSANPYKILEVQRATFDQPWHMQDITIEDIGVVYGTQFHGPGGARIWSGVDFVSNEEFWKEVYLYGLWPERRILELLADGSLTPDQSKVERYIEWLRNKTKAVRAEYVKKHGKEPWLDLAVPKAPGEKDEWDVYVEKFIAEHKLTQPAVKWANEILERAKKIRDVRRIQNRSEIAEAKRKGDAKKLAYYEELEKRIFDRVLVHNLRRLIPEEQKQEANQDHKPEQPPGHS